MQRRIPSALDVAFAAFGNDQVVPLLVERMTAKDGRPFRDGLNYQHNLAAVRNVVIHLLGGVKASNHAAALRRLNAHPEEALALLDLPQRE